MHYTIGERRIISYHMQNKERVGPPHHIDEIESISIGDLVRPLEWHRFTGENTHESSFYIVIPAHNERETIRPVLENLLVQRLPDAAHYTIHVISNGSVDGTEHEVISVREEIVSRINQEREGLIELKLTSLSGGNKPAALNEGRNQATSDLVINMDADIFPTPNALAKLYALMRINPNCAAASVMPRRIKTLRDSSLQHAQDYYDAITRENGAIIGKLIAYRPSLLPEYPEEIGSEDSWMEFTALSRYGADSIEFLGQNHEGDIAAEYYGTSTCIEFGKQLLRWESEFRKLVTTYPQLLDACRMADRVERPHGLIELFQHMHTDQKEIPTKDKLLMYYGLKLARKLAKHETIMRTFGTGSSWSSPKSDRAFINANLEKE